MRNKSVELGSDGSVVMYAKAVFTACIFALCILILMSVIITYSGVSELIMPMVASITIIISSLVGGMHIGSKAKRKGWLNGSLVGLIYIILMMMIGSLIAEEFVMGMNLLYKVLMGVIAGGIGGIVGVNLK